MHLPTAFLRLGTEYIATGIVTSMVHKETPHQSPIVKNAKGWLDLFIVQIRGNNGKYGVENHFAS